MSDYEKLIIEIEKIHTYGISVSVITKVRDENIKSFN